MNWQLHMRKNVQLGKSVWSPVLLLWPAKEILVFGPGKVLEFVSQRSLCPVFMENDGKGEICEPCLLKL